MAHTRLKIVIPRETEASPDEIEREETQFDRKLVDAESVKAWKSIANRVAGSLGIKKVRWQLRLQYGDKNYPYLRAAAPENDHGIVTLDFYGWNETLYAKKCDGTEVCLMRMQQSSCAAMQGSHLYFSDGTFKFQTHGQKERKGSEDYPVIEDLGGDQVRAMFPDRYVRLPDGREGISTEGLTKGDLEFIMRTSGHRIAEEGEKFHQVNIKDWRKDLERRAREIGVPLS